MIKSCQLDRKYVMNRSIRFVYKLLIGFLLSGCLNRMLLDMLARCRMVHSRLSSKLNYYNTYKSI